MSELTRLSNSRINSLLMCSWKFLCNYVLKLPEPTHPKTAAGTLCHLIFEVLRNPRHHHHYNVIIKENTVYASRPIKRLIESFCKKNNVAEEISCDVDAMVLEGLKEDFFCEGAVEVYPEFEFNISKEGVDIKGFIDVLAIYDDGRDILVRDFKSQKNRFLAEELEFSIQSLCYQWAVRELFGKKSAVEFVLLRHPNTKKKPNNLIQRVEPFSDEDLDAFEEYIIYLGKYLRDYDLKKAKVNFCAKNPSKSYFCKYVCHFVTPFQYFALVEGDKIIKTSKTKKDLTPKENQYIVLKEYRGCPFFNRQDYAINENPTKDLKVFP